MIDPAGPRVGRPTLEHHRETLGIGAAAPRLSWRTVADPSWTQGAYELEVTRSGAVTRTGRTPSPESVLVAWPGAPLRSREAAAVRVRVWGASGDPSDWSEETHLEVGLLRAQDWVAQAIGPSWPEDRDSARRPPLVRREFDAVRPVRSARLYVSAHGLYEVELNGTRIGAQALAPGWTVYGKRLRYQTFDVTGALVPGANALGAWLGDGWYRGRLGFDGGHSNLYGDRVALIAQLEITHDDGAVTVVATDASWRAGVGPLQSAGLLDGERYDAREERPGWSTAGFDETGWSPVVVGDRGTGTLVAPQGPPVRCTEEVKPVQVTRLAGDRLVVDFGQNLTGRLRMTVRGERGRRITVRHAEILQDGELFTAPLRGAKATDEYTLRGGGPETWEPRFTIHGFRYAEVTGWSGGAVEDNLVARVYHTDLARTGWFECSNPLVNRLHENIVWSMRGNFVDIPTDCPQRDERLGWTGDLQIFAPTATFLYDCAGMLSSWLQDVAAEQLPDGTVPWYVPVIPGGAEWTPIRPGAAWGDVAVLTPWTLYERFGDAGVLATQFESARAWVDCVARLAGETGLWDSGFQLGDWLDPAAPPEDPAAGRTDRYLIASAYFARSARTLAQIAAVLGRPRESDRYGRLAARARSAFRAAYVRPGGQVSEDSQTAYAVALRFGLLEGAEEAAAGRRLAELVAAASDTLETGFVGTPLLCDALTDTGGLRQAYALLLQEGCPSWLYAVNRGATTTWERWDSLLPDGRVNPGQMTSFNHYAFGAVADWLHRVVAGLESASPGFRDIRFRPRPGGGLSSAAASHDSPYGRVAIAWTLLDGRLTVEVEVPTGARAQVDLPGGEVYAVGPGTHVFSSEGSRPGSRPAELDRARTT